MAGVIPELRTGQVERCLSAPDTNRLAHGRACWKEHLDWRNNFSMVPGFQRQEVRKLGDVMVCSGLAGFGSTS